MKVLFVYPRFEKFLASLPELDEGLARYFLGDFTTPPSLGIPILAGLTPPEVAIEFVDDNGGQPLDLDTDADLIAINCFTPQATRAFEIADLYRSAGRRVILGGLFPTFMPEECLKHADAVNLGEGEPTWVRILDDVRQGRLQPRYVGGCNTDLASVPLPRRDIFYQNRFYDWDEELVQVSRGCVYTCSMCALPAQMGGRIRFRPIEQVVAEIRGLKHENVYLADDTLFFPHRKLADYSRALFEALVPLGKKYFVSSTMALNTDPGFLELAARAGVRNFYCTLNVDPLSIRALQGDARGRQALVDLVRRTEDLGMRFFASCGLGRDWDPPDIADRILELFDAANIHTAEFFVFTPYPGSVHWDRLQHQGRILDRHWAHYNGAHVVARPQNMSPEQLREQFVRVWQEFFRRKRDRHTAALEPATWQDGVQVVGKPLQRQGVSRQAAITGLGLLSPIGHEPASVTEALRTGRHGLAPVARFASCGFRTDLGGEVRDFDPGRFLTAAEMEEYEDAYLRMAMVAARRALEAAGLAIEGSGIRRDVALVLGTCNGGLNSAEAEYAWKHGRSPRPFDERMNLQSQLYGFGKALASALRLGGETYVVTTACSSTTVALGLAQRLVNRGYYSKVLVGGADVLCVANVAGFDALKATATGRMAPFSLPYGLNVGEASCFWVVEDLEAALLRGAACLGRLVGHATTSDGHHPTTPDPRGFGVHRVLVEALADSGLTVPDLGCVNAHGTGTEANDKAESKGIARFLNGHALPVVSTKSFFGHCMGATGILEASCQLLAMNAGFIPPTLNSSEPRPGCAHDFVPNQARVTAYDSFIASNCAFGGNNAAVVISRRDRTVPARTRPDERVVITGTGCVTSLGLGTPANLRALHQGEVGLREFTAAPREKTRAQRVGQVAPFKGDEVDRRIDFAALNPISRFAVAAARFALDDASLRVTPKSGDAVGVVMGVCNGPSEMDHMDCVFSSDNFQAHVGSFSNITANSTAGWVSTSLALRGVNASLSAGPHAGLQALAYAFDALAENRARALVMGASDEVYPQTFVNYDRIGFLHSGEEESDYRLRLEVERGMVLGEGAGMMVMETATAARERGARVLAEVLGYGMSMDAEGFVAPNLGLDGLQFAIELALRRAGVAAGEVDLLVWAPQGSRRDLKILDCARRVWGDRFDQLPLLTTTFNTGHIESASILISLAAALALLSDGSLKPWPQRTGLANLDRRPVPTPPRVILALASSDFGYNFAAVLRPGPLS